MRKHGQLTDNCSNTATISLISHIFDYILQILFDDIVEKKTLLLKKKHV